MNFKTIFLIELRTKLRLFGLACLISLSSIHLAEAAILNQWGTVVNTSIADCPSFSCTNFNFGPFDGGLGFDNVASQMTEIRGNAKSEASLTGSASTPVLRAEAFARVDKAVFNPDKRGAFASAFGVQGYTYSGTDTTLNLDATLVGSLFDPDNSDWARIRGVVAVFQTDPFEFQSDEAALVAELGAQYAQTTGGTDARMQFDLLSTGSIAQMQSISFDVTDGDQFYVWAWLRAGATSSNSASGSAEAFNSLTMTFQDANGLQAASAVPVPAAVWLFGSGLIGLIGIARRKKA